MRGGLFPEWTPYGAVVSPHFRDGGFQTFVQTLRLFKIAVVQLFEKLVFGHFGFNELFAVA